MSFFDYSLESKSRSIVYLFAGCFIMLLFAMPPGHASAAEAESSVTKPEEAVIFFRHLYGTSKDVFGSVRRCSSDICDKDRIYLERSAESRSQEQLDIALNEYESDQGVGIVTMENPVSLL